MRCGGGWRRLRSRSAEHVRCEREHAVYVNPDSESHANTRRLHHDPDSARSGIDEPDHVDAWVPPPDFTRANSDSTKFAVLSRQSIASLGAVQTTNEASFI